MYRSNTQNSKDKEEEDNLSSLLFLSVQTSATSLSWLTVSQWMAVATLLAAASFNEVNTILSATIRMGLASDVPNL